MSFCWLIWSIINSYYSVTIDEVINELKPKKGAEIKREVISLADKQATFEIVKAIYGIKNQTIDATAKLNALIKNGKLFIPAGPGESNKAAGNDPFVGQLKEWDIKYKVNGQEKTAKFIENTKIELP